MVEEVVISHRLLEEGLRRRLRFVSDVLFYPSHEKNNSSINHFVAHENNRPGNHVMRARRW